MHNIVAILNNSKEFASRLSFPLHVMVHPASGIRIYIRMEKTPGVLARVLGPFAVAGLAPYELLLRPGAGDLAFVVADFESLDRDRAFLFVEKVRQMPCVTGVRLSAARTN
jgi:hypothetical protein